MFDDEKHHHLYPWHLAHGPLNSYKVIYGVGSISQYMHLSELVCLFSGFMHFASFASAFNTCLLELLISQLGSM